MAEDDSDPNGFVWVNDARENGHGHVVLRGTAGLSTDVGSAKDVTNVQMNIPDDLADELVELYEDLDKEFYQRYGEQLEPNQLFWANGVEVMLDNADELRNKIGIK